ncbi:MAG: EAL domain-containing protein [Sutterella sp.]|nr:EAL domain-containing protein [Sutterella sp.]
MNSEGSSKATACYSHDREWFVAEAAAFISSRPKGAALVSLDVSDFKVVNLVFGRRTGDRMLRHIYETVESFLEPGEFLIRDTADIFYAVLATQDRATILERLTAVRSAFDAEMLTGSAHTPYLELRFGVYLPENDGTPVEKMIEYANMARKHSLRNLRVTDKCFYCPERAQHKVEEKQRAAELVEAMEKRQFVVFLQPKVNLKTGRIAGAEALVRWNHPERGILAPGLFIPLLERCRLVHRIDIFVFEEVCRLLAKWQREGRELFPISVNLSRETLDIPNLLPHFKTICDELGVPRRLIEIEITETSFAGSFEKICDFVRSLNAEGFSCSLDDFGFGYSSLGCLQRLPVDTVKLDRSFFVGSFDEERSRMIVSAMTCLANRLGLKTVAEGIEDIEQLDYLKRTCCDMVQGFVFYRPMSAADFEREAFSGRSSNATDVCACTG